MVGIVEITAGLNSLKAAKDIVQALHGAQSAVAINEVKLELQGAILDAQQGLFLAQEAQTAAAKRIGELEREIAQIRSWDAEKQRYELADTGQGSLAYRPKAGMENGEPQHWLCPGCFQQGEKSIMKRDNLPVGRTSTLNCHPCGLEIITAGQRHTPAEGIRGAGRSGRR